MTPTKTGILLVNLGTPDSPETADVRRYLKEFLLDPRVIDIPAVPRNLLVRGIIAPFRSPKSAATYRKVWTKAGSPLMTHSLRQRDLLRAALGPDYQVELAMRYQNPSVASALALFKGKMLRKIKVIPLFPQYASATTGSVMQAVMDELRTWQTIPPVELVNSYPVLPELVQVFAERARALDLSRFDYFLFSYHGLPQRQLVKADCNGVCLKHQDCCAEWTEQNYYCYSAQCHATTDAIVSELDLPLGSYTTCFQSRLGRAEWTRPYTADLIKTLPQEGKKRVLVFSPAFTSDCLETIFELGEEYKEEFLHGGGELYEWVPSLNDHPRWIEGLKQLAIH